MAEQTVQLPRQARAATVRVQSYQESDNSIEVAFTTGADVLRCDWLDGPYIERLETGPENVRLNRLNAGASFLDTHNAFELRAVIGSVVPGSAKMEDGEGLARVRLSRAAGSADIVTNIRDGIISNISVGYLVHAFTRTEAEAGAPAIMTATDWEPVEISAVPVPADPGAQIRAAQRSASGLEVHPCVITRAEPGQPKEPDMASRAQPEESGKTTKDEKTDAKPETRPDEKTDQKGGRPEAPNNPKDNPDMVKAPPEVEPAKPQVPGQIVPQDPGDANPLPLAGPDLERKLREVARDAVKHERERANEITRLAEHARFVDFGAEHVRKGTDLSAFRDLLTDKLIDARSEDGGPSGTAQAEEPSLRETHATDMESGAAAARRFLRKPAKGA